MTVIDIIKYVTIIILVLHQNRMCIILCINYIMHVYIIAIRRKRRARVEDALVE